MKTIRINANHAQESFDNQPVIAKKLLFYLKVKRLTLNVCFQIQKLANGIKNTRKIIITTL